MTTISRSDAFNAVATAMEQNEYESAQRMLKIVSEAILEEKRVKRILTQIVLRDESDERLFARAMDGRKRS